MNGWIKLQREFSKWEWYQDANTMRVFLHVLLLANHKQAKWQGNAIERGQLITSRDHLATALGISVQSVRTSLSKLQKSENITIKSTSKFTVISVCNYDTYQSGDGDTNQQINQQSTSDQPAINQRSTTNKNVKKNNNEKNEEKIESAPTKSEDQIRISKLFNKRPTTPFDRSEKLAWSSAKDIVTDLTEVEWSMLETYYAAPQQMTYARKSLATLLNNLSGELDKAADWSRQHTNAQRKISTPTVWS